MQPYDKNDQAVGPIEQFNPERLEALLENPKVKTVKVFRLKKGMIINIEGHEYKVIAVRPNGKATLRPRSRS